MTLSSKVMEPDCPICGSTACRGGGCLTCSYRILCGHAQPILKSHTLDDDPCDAKSDAHSWRAAMCRVREKIIR
jgi:hypothetical protein